MAENSLRDASRGRTVIESRALASLASVVTATRLGVSPGQVEVTIGDDAARVALRVKAPVGMSVVAACATSPNRGSIFDYVTAERQEMARNFSELSGLEVGKIDFTITGVASETKKRRQLK